MSLVLRRAYFDNLDRWVFENKPYWTAADQVLLRV